jgi:CheY-like chemotaxis protein
VTALTDSQAHPNEVLRVPRVLIADDNSNVQKMVTLALKDAGIEVVAVGNGEAAVRKMPEITPDLVLADVFMPVRSGYEVCEFVKQDPRFMHTPVVLLVGAFDPLDEREARRVQADGVLKKPFVPPDPLVSMVTSLLAKSAVLRQVAVTVPAGESADARNGKAAATPAPDESLEGLAGETPEEFSNLPAAVTFADGDKPVAFSALLETPVASTDQSDPVVTAKRDPVLGEPAFWTAPPPAEEPTPDDLTDGHAWETPLPDHDSSELLQPLVDGALPESSAMADEFAELGATLDDSVEDIEELAPAATEPLPEPEPEAQPELHQEPQSEAQLEPQRDEQSEAQVDIPNWDEAPVETAPATPCALSAADPWPQRISEARAEAEEPTTPELETPAPAETSPLPDAISETPAVEQMASNFAASAAVPQTRSAAEAAPMMSATVEPAATQMVEESTPARSAALPAPTPPASAATAPKLPAESPSERWVELLSVSEDLPAASEPWKSAKESFTWARNKQPELQAVAAKVAGEQPMPKLVSAPSTPAIELEPSSNQSSNTVPAIADPATNSAAVNPELMEAVVARVIERMQPKMLEIVTHEILRPVVEALVRRELEKK